MSAFGERTTFDLEALQQADLPRATTETIGFKVTIDDDAGDRPSMEAEAAKLLAAMNAYLARFAAGFDCPGCKNKLGGLLGTFTYGLAHGEGYCSHCSYPCRANHYPEDDLRFVLIMPYHPSELRRPAPTASTEGAKP